MKTPVYFTPAHRGESSEEIARKAAAVFLRTGFPGALEPGDFTALKLHFGEKHNTGHIKPAWIRDIIAAVRGATSRAFLTDSNTLYVGNRSNSIDHIRLAWDHGFTQAETGLPVIIADGLVGRDKSEARAAAAAPGRGAAGKGKGKATAKTGAGASGIAAAKIASAILHSDAMLCLTHVTGHVQTGLGAAIKNLGMGCASRAGKLEQHATVHPHVSAKQCRNCSMCMEYCPEDAISQAEGHVVILREKCIGCGECLAVCKHGAVKFAWDEDSPRLQRILAEYANLVRAHFGPKIAFVNFLLQVTKDCDCMAKDQPPIVPDIGILASSDAVAADRATADLIVQAGRGKDALRAGYDLDWSVQLRHGEEIGLGSNDYELISI